MMYCETHKDGRIHSTAAGNFCLYSEQGFDPVGEGWMCVITEWVEKKVHQAQTERYNDLLMRIEGLLEEVAE